MTKAQQTDLEKTFEKYRVIGNEDNDDVIRGEVSSEFKFSHEQPGNFQILFRFICCRRQRPWITFNLLEVKFTKLQMLGIFQRTICYRVGFTSVTFKFESIKTLKGPSMLLT
jgi:hypothetical protein